jgi:hypothetical protein
VELPPSATGIMWSNSKFSFEPHLTHLALSLRHTTILTSSEIYLVAGFPSVLEGHLANSIFKHEFARLL